MANFLYTSTFWTLVNTGTSKEGDCPIYNAAKTSIEEFYLLATNGVRQLRSSTADLRQARMQNHVIEFTRGFYILRISICRSTNFHPLLNYTAHFLIAIQVPQPKYRHGQMFANLLFNTLPRRSLPSVSS